MTSHQWQPFFLQQLSSLKFFTRSTGLQAMVEEGVAESWSCAHEHWCFNINTTSLSTKTLKRSLA